MTMRVSAVALLSALALTALSGSDDWVYDTSARPADRVSVACQSFPQDFDPWGWSCRSNPAVESVCHGILTVASSDPVRIDFGRPGMVIIFR